MTIVVRTFVSLPQRSASATWESIIKLVAPDPNSPARRALDAAAGTACSCIADETLANDSLVVSGAGPRLRVYALYGDDAIERDGANESPLSFVPTEGDWWMSIPCLPEDLAWVQRSLKAVSSRMSARAVGESPDPNEDGIGDGRPTDSMNAPAPIAINRDAFFRR